MKAIRIHSFGGTEVLKLEEIAAPRPVGGQVLVSVRAIGVNPVDTYIRAGKYGPREFPFTPGFDAAGTVEAVGPDVKKFKAGDRVYVSRTISGAYAEKTLVEEDATYSLSEHLTFPQGAALGVPYATAYRALHLRGQAKPGEVVLVHGATGSVGLAATQMARAFGCVVIGTGGSEEGRKLVLTEGAHHVLDHHQAGYLDKAKELTGGKGIDVILEMLANENLAKDLPVLAYHGRLVVIGSRGKIEIDPRDAMSREADIRGVALPTSSPEELRLIHAAIKAGLDNHTLRPIVDKEMPLADAAKAHEEVLEGNSHGKIVLAV